VFVRQGSFVGEGLVVVVVGVGVFGDGCIGVVIFFGVGVGIPVGQEPMQYIVGVT